MVYIVGWRKRERETPERGGREREKTRRCECEWTRGSDGHVCLARLDNDDDDYTADAKLLSMCVRDENEVRRRMEYTSEFLIVC